MYVHTIDTERFDFSFAPVSLDLLNNKPFILLGISYLQHLTLLIVILMTRSIQINLSHVKINFYFNFKKVNLKYWIKKKGSKFNGG